VVSFDGPKAPATDTFDRMLVAVGRSPNGKLIGAEAAGVTTDGHGFIPVDSSCGPTWRIYSRSATSSASRCWRTRRCTREGGSRGDGGEEQFLRCPRHPVGRLHRSRVAWAGVTENEARAAESRTARGLPLGRQRPLAHPGPLRRADEGAVDEGSGRTIGCGIVGPNAGDLIAEAALAIEMGADAADIGLTIHPHPTLSETVALAAEAFEGTITDLYLPRRGKD